MPASGSPTKPDLGLSSVIVPIPLEPWMLWWSSIISSQPMKRSWNRWLSIGP